MSETELDPVEERVREQYIIDSDFHLNVTVEELLPYVDDSLRNRIFHETAEEVFGLDR